MTLNASLHMFLNFTAQPSLDVDATNSRIAEALSSADTANVTANSAYGLANTANQTVEHMRTRFDSIDTALATHNTRLQLCVEPHFPAPRPKASLRGGASLTRDQCRWPSQSRVSPLRPLCIICGSSSTLLQPPP
jgi:hypothetical protein